MRILRLLGDSLEAIEDTGEVAGVRQLRRWGLWWRSCRQRRNTLQHLLKLIQLRRGQRDKEFPVSLGLWGGWVLEISERLGRTGPRGLPVQRTCGRLPRAVRSSHRRAVAASRLLPVPVVRISGDKAARLSGAAASLRAACLGAAAGVFALLTASCFGGGRLDFTIKLVIVLFFLVALHAARLVLLHRDLDAINEMVFTFVQHLLDGCRVLHHDKAEIAWPRARSLTSVRQGLHLGMCHAHLKHLAVLCVMTFQKALRAEPEFVDPAHDEDTPWVLRAKLFQVASQGLLWLQLSPQA
mmetsp:Transcript_15444/g.36489  ORF Transcript_15444/g.36489 Transcript_15444/m.36489 type:complete len:297 (+) Transcript_15444:1401-2291(+)